MNNLGYDGVWDLFNLKHVALAGADQEKYTVRPGDLLFNRTNSPELVGKAGVWELDKPFAFAGYLIRVRFDEKPVLPDYVSGYLNSVPGKWYLFDRAKPSNTMSNFSASMFAEIPLGVPPLPLQNGWKALVAAHRDQVVAMGRQGAEADHLFTSLLHRAFAGEL